jgi:hypothetical protein
MDILGEVEPGRDYTVTIDATGPGGTYHDEVTGTYVGREMSMGVEYARFRATWPSDHYRLMPVHTITSIRSA